MKAIANLFDPLIKASAKSWKNLSSLTGSRGFSAVAGLASTKLADLIRQHDIYITASLHDPCSNALIEALSCGLPVIYASSGGHPEIVGEAGFGFDSADEVPGLLERLVDEYEQRQNDIRQLSLAQVTDLYLDVMQVVP